ncbi:hypothetical protein [Algibacter mikhailovii]|uniref:hypothetical protein n=1 Tax=Algibacter mikhailovii TaxID=425498 RepID=UPI00249415A4|nr:hypothetical protein [Algibacter mikhailovii]
MKNLFLSILFLMISIMTFSQNTESSTRKLINDATFTRVNRDWSTFAELKSGIGETVRFYPIEVIDLKSGEKTKALQLDMQIKNPTISKTAWVGIEEIEEFVTFIEKYVIPFLELKYNDRSVEYIFNANEVTLSYLIFERKRRLTIKLNNYDDDCGCSNYMFWTETQVEKITGLLEVLKTIK